MFTGIVETQSPVLALKSTGPSAKLKMKKPESFDDLRLGDSIAHNGVCLTLETFDSKSMEFTLGPETLKLTSWGTSLKPGDSLNLERSMKVGDRIHGHIVSGHVESMGHLSFVTEMGDSKELWIEFSEKLRGLIFPKGSVAVNGVSLTVNLVKGQSFQVILIPETLKRTNLSQLKVGDSVCLEADMMAKAIREQVKTMGGPSAFSE